MIENLLPMLNDFVADCCVKKVHYEPKGVTNIEAFYLWALVGYYKPDIILESGVSRARSTEILAKAQQFFNIPHHYAFDKEDVWYKYSSNKLKPYATKYSVENSVDGFKRVLAEHPGSKIVCFMDGPKHGPPYMSLVKMLSKGCDLQCVVSHDCYPKGKTVLTKESLEKAHKSYLPNYQLLFTNPDMNVKLNFLNGYIHDEMVEFNKGFMKDNKFHYIGLCYK